MVRKEFSDVEDFGLDILRCHELGQEMFEFYAGTIVIGYYDLIRNLLSYFIKEHDYIPYDINLNDEGMTGYGDEYILTIDGDNQLWIEPMRRGDRYISVEADFCFIDGDCNSQIIVQNRNQKFIEISIDGDDE